MSNNGIIPGRFVVDPTWGPKMARSFQTFVDQVSRVLSGDFVLSRNGAYDIVNLEFVQQASSFPLYFSTVRVSGPPVGVLALQCVSMPSRQPTDYTPVFGWAYSDRKRQPYVTQILGPPPGSRSTITLLVLGG